MVKFMDEQVKKRGRPRIHDDAGARHKAWRVAESRVRLDVWVDPATDRMIKELANDFGVSRAKIVEAALRFDGNLLNKIRMWCPKKKDRKVKVQ